MRAAFHVAGTPFLQPHWLPLLFWALSPQHVSSASACYLGSLISHALTLFSPTLLNKSNLLLIQDVKYQRLAWARVQGGRLSRWGAWSQLPLPTTLKGWGYHFPSPTPPLFYQEEMQPQRGYSVSLPQGQEVSRNVPGLQPGVAWPWGASGSPPPQDLPGRAGLLGVHTRRLKIELPGGSLFAFFTHSKKRHLVVTIRSVIWTTTLQRSYFKCDICICDFFF